MKQCIIGTLLLFFSSFSMLSAQHLTVGEPLPTQCGTDKAYKEAIERDPALKVRQEQIDRAYQETVERLAQSPRPEGGLTIYTIPVVVHVMYLAGTPVGKDENISAALVQAGVQHMTEAYRKQQTEYNGTGHNANITGVDVEFQFQLAQRDPSGNPTDGINRVATTYSNLDRGSSAADLAMKDLSRWDPTKYMNIWLVKEICYFSTNECGVAGYAYFASAHGQSYDGIVNEAAFFGSSRHNSKVHIHEGGHYFNLYHTFQGGCTNSNCLTDGDLVCDTPPDNSTNSVTCGASGTNSCTTDVNDITAQNPFRPVVNGGIGDQEDSYENYMDYGFQTCQTTFTAGQKVRMVAALTGTRASLITSNNALVVSTTSALAFFGDDGAYANESAATTAIDCRTYIDVNVPIQLYNTPTSAVTVNVGVSGASTATSGSDFALQTSSVVIAAGVSTGNIVLRIFNDKAIESTETIVLTVSSASGNGGNTGVAAFNTTYTYTLIDDDNAPNGTAPVLFSSDFTVSTGIGNNSTNSWIFSSFGAGTTNVFKIGSNGGTCTTDNSLYVTNNTTTLPNAYDAITSSPLVYRSIDATGYTGLTITYDFKIGGVSAKNVGRLVIRNPGGSGSFSLVSGATNINNTVCSTGASRSLSSTFNNATFDFGFNFDTQVGNGNPGPSFTIDNFQVTAAATAIASATTETSTAYLGPNSTVYFKSTGGSLLAKIENLSSHDYGCTTIAVDRAGTSSVSNGQTYKYSSKTFTVTPTTNNASGSYKITTYYTAAERDGWVAAAGGYTAAEIKVLKTSGTIATATDASTSFAATTASAFGANYGYTAQFSTGFSGFAIGASPASLAVDLLSFVGKKEQKEVKLTWETASEYENDYFLIEKSVDGKQFSTLGQVKGRGTSSQKQQYDMFDKTPSVGVNYYRLTSVDKTGKETNAQIVAVNFIEKATMSIYPNPSNRSNITLNYNTESKGHVFIEWVDIVGRVRKQVQENLIEGTNQFPIDLSDLESGLYFVRTRRDMQIGDMPVIRFIKY